jgi:hypothetical protein
MKAVAIALVLMGFVTGCARLESMHQSMQSSLPKAAPAPADRPDLVHKSASACEQEGRQWNGTSGVCM